MASAAPRRSACKRMSGMRAVVRIGAAPRAHRDRRLAPSAKRCDQDRRDHGGAGQQQRRRKPPPLRPIGGGAPALHATSRIVPASPQALPRGAPTRGPSPSRAGTRRASSARRRSEGTAQRRREQGSRSRNVDVALGFHHRRPTKVRVESRGRLRLWVGPRVEPQRRHPPAPCLPVLGADVAMLDAGPGQLELAGDARRELDPGLLQHRIAHGLAFGAPQHAQQRRLLLLQRRRVDRSKPPSTGCRAGAACAFGAGGVRSQVPLTRDLPNLVSFAASRATLARR